MAGLKSGDSSYQHYLNEIRRKRLTAEIGLNSIIRVSNFKAGHVPVFFMQRKGNADDRHKDKNCSQSNDQDERTHAPGLQKDRKCHG